MVDSSREAPKRIQRKRTKGWKMPEGAVYVGRPTKWGNPYKGWNGFVYPPRLVELYRELLDDRRRLRCEAKQELAGKDLACWCPLDQPCHADVLLEIANGPKGEG